MNLHIEKLLVTIFYIFGVSFTLWAFVTNGKLLPEKLNNALSFTFWEWICIFSILNIVIDFLCAMVFLNYDAFKRKNQELK